MDSMNLMLILLFLIVFGLFICVLVKQAIQSKDYTHKVGTLYPRTLTYTKSDEFSAAEQALIDHWMDYMSVVTCLTFTPVSNPPSDPTEPYLSFVLSKEKFSSSYVGHWKGISRHNIYLTHGILTRNADMLHEVMHAIGFEHEHSRPDRDEFIELRWSIFRSTTQKDYVNYGCFRKVRGQSLSYDYYSIMHYSPDSFNNHSNISRFAVRQKGIDQTLIGQTYGLTELDVRKINTEYGCPNWLDNQLKEEKVRRLPLSNTGAFIIWPNTFGDPVNFP